MHDEPIISAVDHHVIRAVFHPALPRKKHRQLRILGLQVQEVHLGGDLGTAENHQVALGSGGAHARPEVFVVLAENQLVLLHGGAHGVLPHLVWAPGFIHTLVVQGIVAHPGRAVGHAGDLIRKFLASVQVPNLQQEALVAFGIHGVGQQTAIAGHAGGTQGEKIVALCLDVRIEVHLLIVSSVFLMDLWWHPGVCVENRDPAHLPVGLALLRPDEIPVVAGAHGQGLIGLLHAGLDLVKHRIFQRLEVASAGCGVLVLRVQIRANVWVVLVPQPFIIIGEIAAVEAAGERNFRGDGCCGCRV